MLEIKQEEYPKLTLERERDLSVGALRSSVPMGETGEKGTGG